MNITRVHKNDQFRENNTILKLYKNVFLFDYFSTTITRIVQYKLNSDLVEFSITSITSLRDKHHCKG